MKEIKNRHLLVDLDKRELRQFQIELSEDIHNKTLDKYSLDLKSLEPINNFIELLLAPYYLNPLAPILKRTTKNTYTQEDILAIKLTNAFNSKYTKALLDNKKINAKKILHHFFYYSMQQTKDGEINYNYLHNFTKKHLSFVKNLFNKTRVKIHLFKTRKSVQLLTQKLNSNDKYKNINQEKLIKYLALSKHIKANNDDMDFILDIINILKE